MHFFLEKNLLSSKKATFVGQREDFMKNTQSIQDTILLSDIQKGDKKAYGILFRRYYPMLCAYANRFIAIEDSEEIVQDIMLWLWENREIQIINTSLSQYLFRAVYHRSMNRIALNQSYNRADTLFYESMHEMLQDTDFYQIEELKERINGAIQALPESYREAFVMHRFQDMSYKEIASQLGISHKTIDYRIQQALKQLRIDLKEYLPLFLPFLLS